MMLGFGSPPLARWITLILESKAVVVIENDLSRERAMTSSMAQSSHKMIPHHFKDGAAPKLTSHFASSPLLVPTHASGGFNLNFLGET